MWILVLSWVWSIFCVCVCVFCKSISVTCSISEVHLFKCGLCFIVATFHFRLVITDHQFDRRIYWNPMYSLLFICSLAAFCITPLVISCRIWTWIWKWITCSSTGSSWRMVHLGLVCEFNWFSWTLSYECYSSENESIDFYSSFRCVKVLFHSLSSSLQPPYEVIPHFINTNLRLKLICLKPPWQFVSEVGIWTRVQI